MVYVHLVRGEVGEAPVTPRGAPFLNPPPEPRSSIPTCRTTPTPCTAGTDTRPTLIRPVMRLTAAPVRSGLRAVDTAHVRPPGRRPGACCRVPAPGLEPGNSAADIPSGPVPRTSHRWVSGQGCCPRRRNRSGQRGGPHGFTAVQSPERAATRPQRPPVRVRGARATRRESGYSDRRIPRLRWVRGNPALKVL